MYYVCNKQLLINSVSDEEICIGKSVLQNNNIIH